MYITEGVCTCDNCGEYYPEGGDSMMCETCKSDLCWDCGTECEGANGDEIGDIFECPCCPANEEDIKRWKTHFLELTKEELVNICVESLRDRREAKMHSYDTFFEKKD